LNKDLIYQGIVSSQSCMQAFSYKYWMHKCTNRM